MLDLGNLFGNKINPLPNTIRLVDNGRFVISDELKENSGIVQLVEWMGVSYSRYREIPWDTATVPNLNNIRVEVTQPHYTRIEFHPMSGPVHTINYGWDMERALKLGIIVTSLPDFETDRDGKRYRSLGLSGDERLLKRAGLSEVGPHIRVYHEV